MPNEQRWWRKLFDSKFRREDGLIDKYVYDENGDIVATPDAIEELICQVEDAAFQKCKEIVEKAKSPTIWKNGNPRNDSVNRNQLCDDISDSINNLIKK